MITLVLYTLAVLVIGVLIGACSTHDMIRDCAKSHELFIDIYEIIDTREDKSVVIKGFGRDEQR
jgi:hypothetical protein